MAKFSIKGGIDFNNTKFKAGLKDSANSADKFSNKMGKVSARLGQAFAVAAVAKFAKAEIDLATQIFNDAKKVRVGTDAYQAWLEVVEKTGGSASNALGALGDLQIRQSEAINGNAGAAKAFEDLGISMDQVSGASMEQLLDMVAKGTQETGNLAAAARVLGADNLRGVNIALKEVANEGLQSVIDKTDEAGRLFSEEFTTEASEFSNFWKDFGAKFKKTFANNIIAPLLQLPEAAKAAWQATKDVFTGDIAIMGWRNRASQIMADLNAATEDAEEQTSTINDRLQAVLDANKSKGGGAAGNAGAAGAVQREYSSLRRIGANIIGNNRPRERHQDAMKKAAETQVKLQEEIRDNTAEAATVNDGSRF